MNNFPGHHEPTGPEPPPPLPNQSSEPIEALKAELAAAQQRLDALLAAQRQPDAPEQAQAAPEPPPVSAGEPGMHYSGEHLPNQHPPGERAPEPVSHVPWEPDTTIEETLDLCEQLWEVARPGTARLDASWPRLRARLSYWEKACWWSLESIPEGNTDESITEYLRRVRWYLYHVHTAPPAAETE